MKILLVSHGYPPEIAAGTERGVERLAAGLTARGHRVLVVCGTFEPRDNVAVEKRARAEAVVYRIHRDDLYFDRWEKTYHPGVSLAFAAILKETKPDIVHIHHFIRLTRDLAWQAALQGIPSVYTLHDFATTCLIGFRAPNGGKTVCDLMPNYKDCVPCASTVAPSVPLAPESEFNILRKDFLNELATARARCVPSRALLSGLAKYHQLPESMFSLVPLAPVADLPGGTPAPEPPPLRVATWGMQMERKGAHVAIEAVKAAGRGLVELDIFGKFDNIQYEERCRALARGAPVRFHGRFEWEELIATPMHISVFPSLTFETYGLTFDESRALGHPVVATDLGAYRERADDSTMLFPAGDSAALAKIFLSLIVNPGKLAEMRLRVARPRAFDDYVTDMERIYQSAAAEGPPVVNSGMFDTLLHPDLKQFAEREALFRRRLSGGQT
ncbi:MAG: glycosyltransferase [Planctomycetes bacterium]|nr:glycosyltransferase [Planctomycetota bacterium]